MLNSRTTVFKNLFSTGSSKSTKRSSSPTPNTANWANVPTNCCNNLAIDCQHRIADCWTNTTAPAWNNSAVRMN